MVERCNTVQNLLKSISETEEGPTITFSPSAKGHNVRVNTKTIGAFDGLRPDSDINTWTFTSSQEIIELMYKEVWSEQTPNRWRLEASYLHAFKPDSHNYDEILEMHCEPNKANLNTKYEIFPHLHFRQIIYLFPSFLKNDDLVTPLLFPCNCTL